MNVVESTNPQCNSFFTLKKREKKKEKNNNVSQFNHLSPLCDPKVWKSLPANFQFLSVRFLSIWPLSLQAAFGCQSTVPES